eukprot:GHVR01138684.1.p1 GENE.GHVR01138684.1~~GHVR01138684.1.p1  ORF type:complete len:168 (-),score=57.09 GHVR01138684.1:199-702(-)
MMFSLLYHHYFLLSGHERKSDKEMKKKKKKKLESVVSQVKKSSSSQKNVSSGGMHKGFYFPVFAKKKLFKWIMSKFKLKIRNLHIRYEHIIPACHRASFDTIEGIDYLPEPSGHYKFGCGLVVTVFDLQNLKEITHNNNTHTHTHTHTHTIHIVLFFVFCIYRSCFA